MEILSGRRGPVSRRPLLTALASWGLGWALFFSSPARGDERVFRVDPGQGMFRVETARGGLFGVFAHDHLVEASRYAGEIRFDPDAPERASVWVEVPAEALTVRDPGVKRDVLRKIESTMKSPRVLDVEHYAKIRFESSSVRPKSNAGDRRLEIAGRLSLHGTVRDVVLPVTFWTIGDTCHAEAETWLRQTDYGIQPYSAGLGTIRVRDEVRVSFHLVGDRVRGGIDGGR